MKIFKETQRFFIVTLLWPIYLISFLFPRNKNIWVFGSYPHTFLDNSKYLFLKYYEPGNEYLIKAIWITKSNVLAKEMRSKGYLSYSKISFLGLYYCCIASVYVYSWTVRDINFWVSGGSKLLNLWHGLPLKNIGLDLHKYETTLFEKTKKYLYNYLYPSRYLKADLFLSTHSSEVSEIFREAYPSNNLINSLYPRVEHFMLAKAESQKFILSVANSEEKKLLNKMGHYKQTWIYMPTFRDNSEDENRMHTKDIFNYHQLNTILQKDGLLMLIKFHVSLMHNVTEYFSNIHFIDNKMDMYVILPNSNGLITDYSSIFFDYYLLNKPVLFYNFDMDLYKKNSRQFYFKYEEAACGPKINTFQELCNWFQDKKYDEITTDYSKHIKRFWGSTNKPYLADQLFLKFKNH